MNDRIGQQLGNYRLIRLLGQGGFADVYLAEHLYLNTKAAIKVLQTRLTSEDSNSFLNEARTIANLVHPHIVRVLDFGLQNNMPYLVMDYAPNRTLRQFYPKGTPLPAERILPYVKQVASALMYAHQRKVVHRDIKPENMLLGNNYEVLLSDFGIATVSQSSRYDSTKQVVGTAGYMAPEQIQGKPRPASDQYALGIVVYEWLSGNRPFHGTFTEVASQHMFAPPPPLREKVPSILPEVEQVVMVALAKDPEKRFGTVEAFATAFEEACQHALPTYTIPASQSPHIAVQEAVTILPQPSPVLTPPVISSGTGTIPQSQPEVLRQAISRRTFVLGLGGLAALVVAGTGITWWELSRRSSVSGSPTTSAPSTSSTPPASTQPAANSSPTTSSTSQPSRPPLGTTIYTYRGHTGQVFADAWSPDGSRIASGSEDTTAQVWDATTGGNVLIYRGHTKQIWTLAWQPHGQQIASGDDNALVQIWDATTATTNYVYRGHSEPVYTVAWAPDGTRIASGGADNTVQVWNPNTGEHQVYSGHSKPVHMVAWSPDGSKIASCSEDMTVQVWDASTLQLYITYTRHTDRVLCVNWSHDGSHIASGSWDQTVQVWEATTGNRLLTYTGHTERVWTVDWSLDDSMIASGSHDGTVQIWSSSTGNKIFTYTGHGLGNTVWEALWSPNGQLIASAGLDGTVQVWQAV